VTSPGEGAQQRLAAVRVAEIASLMSSRLPELTRALHTELAGQITELRGDPLILELHADSIKSNLETFAHVARYDIATEEISAPAAAEEHARRLAQRGTSPNPLIRSYRLGQQQMLRWIFVQIARQERDPQVAFTAGQLIMGIAFRYTDTVSEQVITEYEAEREKWLATRSTAQASMIGGLVAGESIDAAAAEAALGYRLRQNHLGVVVWETGQTASGTGLRELERLVARIHQAAGGCGKPLFAPKDCSTGWGWIPLGRTARPLGPGEIQEVLDEAGAGLYAATGTPAAGAAGFRVTHLEAQRAQQVALLAQNRASRLTSFSDQGVRAAAMLAADLDAAQRLVRTSLGALAADTDSAARLRGTLLTFLAEQGSYTAAAARIHLHKNTVRYRVEAALAERGRPINDDRLDLELALIACRWLGNAVLMPPDA
jgi:DNA-binding PucR family transcriptional regulator